MAFSYQFHYWKEQEVVIWLLMKDWVAILSPLLPEGASGSYFAFDGGLGSNHQEIWLDILVSALWGNNSQQ